MLVFAAVAPGDTEKDASALAAKVLKMKLWDDDAGGRVFYLILYGYRICSNLRFWQWKQNVQDINGEVLCGTLC